MWFVDDAFNLVGYAALPLAALALALAAIVGRRWWLLRGVSAVGAVWLLFMAATHLAVVSPTACRAETLRIVNSNVLLTNERLSELAAAILPHDPDVIVFEELDEDLAAVSPELAAKYPHRLMTSTPWVTIASRLPLLDQRRLPSPPGFPGYEPLTADIEVGGRRLHIVGVHLAAPIGSVAFREHQEQAAAVTDHVRTVARPLVVTGDLNATVTSPLFLRFLWDTGLRSVTDGWFQSPSYWPLPPIIGMRIDHVLLRDAEVCHTEVFEVPGSDHRAVLADVQLPER